MSWHQSRNVEAGAIRLQEGGRRAAGSRQLALANWRGLRPACRVPTSLHIAASPQRTASRAASAPKAAKLCSRSPQPRPCGPRRPLRPGQHCSSARWAMRRAGVALVAVPPPPPASPFAAAPLTAAAPTAPLMQRPAVCKAGASEPVAAEATEQQQQPQQQPVVARRAALASALAAVPWLLAGPAFAVRADLHASRLACCTGRARTRGAARQLRRARRPPLSPAD